MFRDFEIKLNALEDQHLRRQLCVAESASNTTITIDGRKLISMASNNYLGLANHPAVKQAAIEAINQWGVGAGAARLVSGNMEPHQKLEEDLAQFKGVEAVLTFGTGYTANLGLIPSIIDQDGLILADRYCHASLIEGCRLAKAKLRVFHHNDVDHIEKLLKNRIKACPTLVVTEGVFSMDGDLAPLPDLLKLCQNHDATLLLDDAHGTGVMGEYGRGTVEHFGLNPKDLIQMGTLSKAIGISGGYVAGTTSLKEYLINTSKAFIFTTAQPPALATAASAAIQIIKNESGRRQRLWENRNYLYSKLKEIGIIFTNTQSPIIPILVATPEMALGISQELFNSGVYIPAIRPPTVPKHSSRLRITISSEHSKEQLQFVADKICHACKKYGVLK